MGRNCNDCHNCRHSKSNEEYGSAHIRCKFWWDNKPEIHEGPEQDPHGVKNGWCNFPYDYDPIWLTSKCNFFSKR